MAASAGSSGRAARLPAIPHWGRGDIAPGHRGVGWPEVALDSLSGGEEVIVCHLSLPIPTRVIPTAVPTRWSAQSGHPGPGNPAWIDHSS
jgi:hypothetical protein